MVASLQFFSEGFLLGITTGHICLATCGPIYSSFLMQHNRSKSRYITATLEISAGRFLMYLLVGAIAGFIGQQVSDTLLHYFTAASYILLSVFLIITAFRSKKCDSGCKLPKWNRFAEWPFALGLLTGISICPSFLLAFSRSFSLAGPISGMMFFAAFFIGTTIFFIPLSFIGMLGRKKQFRSIARIAAVLVATWFTKEGIHTGYDLISPYFDKRPIINLLDNTPSYILLKDKAASEQYARQLALHRTGKIFVTDTIVNHPNQHYIFTDSIHFYEDSSALRKPNRFVAVITDRYIASPESLDIAINFLKEYHFRFNYKKGDIFFIR